MTELEWPSGIYQEFLNGFYRTEEGRSLDITGSGLGLAICKHIIEAHGQTIHARSTEHVGTTIGFTLERKRSEPRPPPQAENLDRINPLRTTLNCDTLYIPG
jgi:K+-sensing histidine kinase KdpD